MRTFLGLATFGLCLVLFLFFSGTSFASCDGVCAQYCGNGYCTDYIFDQLKTKQKGNAVEWQGNVNADNIKAKDVAIFDSTSTNPYGHVAVIDSINGDQITISEWNYGSLSSDSAKRACGVTNEFGVLHNPVRTISKSSVSKFWRPNFSSDSISMEAQMRVVGQIGWYPANKTCINADYWARIVDNKAVQSLGDYSACYEVGLGYITNPEYADILFGTGDLPEICIQ